MMVMMMTMTTMMLSTFSPLLAIKLASHSSLEHKQPNSPDCTKVAPHHGNARNKNRLVPGLRNFERHFEQTR